MLRKASVLSSLLLTATLMAGSSGDGSEDGTSPRYTRQTASEAGVKTHYATIKGASYSDSLATDLTLPTAVKALIATPREANLDTARTAHKATRTPYQQSEIMRWDTAVAMPNNLDLDGRTRSILDAVLWHGGKAEATQQKMSQMNSEERKQLMVFVNDL